MPTTATPSIFGREVELGVLRAELAGAMQRAGRLLLVTGEPGIGKTSLAAAHAREAEARGALVVWGHCHEVPGAPAYWPWVQVLAELDRASEELSERSVEELRVLREQLRAESAQSAAGPGDDLSRFELFAQVGRALSRIAAKRGLVVVIEDLHWADPVSLRLLQFLSSELSRDSILMIATLRTHEPSSESIFAELARLARSVAVGPLGREAIAELLADRLPVTAANTAAEQEALLGEICAQSDGNPFFVLELAQLLAADPNASGPRDAPLPLGLKKVVERRLAPLPDTTLRLLRAASIMGREFDLAVLGPVVDASASRLVEWIAPAVDIAVVRPVANARDRYTFAHALTRETLYGSLGPLETSRLHGAVGTALEATTDAATLAALAHHFFEAGEPFAESAARYGEAAGRQMLGLFAYEEAAAHFERTLSLLRADAAAPARVPIELGLGRALLGTGERERAEAVSKKALEAAQDAGEDTLFAEAVLDWCSAREEIGVIDRESNRLLEAALARTEGARSRLRARLLARLSSGLHLEPGAESRQRALADEAMKLANALDDPATTGFVQLRAVVGLMGPDYLEQRLAFVSKMLEGARGEVRGELNALSLRIDALAERGDRLGLDAALAAFDEKAETARHPFFRWCAACSRTAIALAEGRYEDAERDAVAALALGGRVQERTPGLQFAQQMFMLRGWQNRLSEIAPLVEGGVETTRVVPAWHCALADLYIMLGRREDARREFDAVAHDDFASLPRDTTWLTAMVLLSSVCARTGDTENAGKLYRLLSPYAGRIAIGSPLVVMVGPVDIRLGQLASLLGRYEEASRHFDDAQALAEHMRASTWQAEIRFHRAQLLRDRGDPADEERVEALLDEAHAMASAVGMALLIEWIDEMRAAGASTGGSRSTVEAVPIRAIFRREGELFELGFDGHNTRLRAMVGLSHLQELLAHPGQEIRALDLAANPGAGEGRPAAASDAGPALDAQARDAYRTRLRDLEDELAEAERRNDTGHRERLSNEIELLTNELSRGFGIGGRPRRAGSTAERARVSVTRAIRYAIRKIAEHDERLAHHLQREVRTGAYCSYDPAERERVTWTL